MTNYETRHIIEALRQGVPSRAVGQYFSEARAGMLRKISDRMLETMVDDRSGGLIVTGRYGEGKTHLLNTVFNMAHADNCVVSLVSLGKETPMDKAYLFYQKVIHNTYLPGREQPGFSAKLEEITLNSPIASELLVYAAKELMTDKLYYVFKSYLGTQDEDEKFALLSDMEGDYLASGPLKKIYRKNFNSVVKFNQSFSKTKHYMDYFRFMSKLFCLMGYNGWVILVDESELIGRLGKKARLKAYENMYQFLEADGILENTFTLFAFSSSYVEDVIDGKNEFAYLEETAPEGIEKIRNVIKSITKASELRPLTADEIRQVLLKVKNFHGQAYGWEPQIDEEVLMKEALANGGYLLRTKIRAAIEFLDQLYQYGEAGNVKIGALGKEIYEENEETPDLEKLDEL